MARPEGESLPRQRREVGVDRTVRVEHMIGGPSCAVADEFGKREVR